MVPRKGECAFATKCVVDFLNYLGYKKVILTCDQEDSIMLVKKSAQREWSGDAGPEESPRYESQSNGSVENANQQVQGLVRTYRDATYSIYEMKIGGNSSMIPWMVRHAAATLSRFKTGQDGGSPLERLKGKKCRKEHSEFGECVMYLKPGTE